MNQLSLSFKDIKNLNSIVASLQNSLPLTVEQREVLLNFLNILPTTGELQSYKIPASLLMAIETLDCENFLHLKKWIDLFCMLPGETGGTMSPGLRYYFDLYPDMIREDVVIIINVSPTPFHRKTDKGFLVLLKGNGSASFYFEEPNDAGLYPSFLGFNGGWAEAYHLLFDLMGKSWNRKEFPTELQRFLPES